MMIIRSFLLLLLTALPFIHTIATDGCRLTNREDRNMDVFWVNLERSVERKNFMSAQLAFYGLEATNRINAMTPNSVLIPEELSNNIDCKTLDNKTSLNFPNMTIPTQPGHAKAVLLSNCGRKKNRKREVAVTISHLNTIRRAIYEGNSSNKYALILEDDLQFAADIDFKDLIASAPADFGILQLVTSNDYAVLELWRVFTRLDLYV
jgi:GR25 family glycosyltransferase involved in LPS biosynthesis